MKIQKEEIKNNTLLNIANTFLIKNFDKTEKILKIIIINNKAIKKLEKEVLNIKTNYNLKVKNIIKIGRNNLCDLILEDLDLRKIKYNIVLKEDKNKNKIIIMLYDRNYKIKIRKKIKYEFTLLKVKKFTIILNSKLFIFCLLQHQLYKK